MDVSMVMYYVFYCFEDYYDFGRVDGITFREFKSGN